MCNFTNTEKKAKFLYLLKQNEQILTYFLIVIIKGLRLSEVLRLENPFLSLVKRSREWLRKQVTKVILTTGRGNLKHGLLITRGHEDIREVCTESTDPQCSGL